jgi:hypothetical protein
MSRRPRTIRLMELLPISNDSSSPVRKGRHVGRWIADFIAVVLVIENLKIVVGLLLVLAIVVLFSALLIVVVLIRKATRPIGQLTVLDVALASWACRWWERRRARRNVRQTQ